MGIFSKFKKMLSKVKELSKSESKQTVKELMKTKQSLKNSHFKVGNTLFLGYNAKDKTQTYDKTPLVLILRRGKTHTLGLNFHWLPYQMRHYLVLLIIKMNINNIKNNKPLEFNYADIKPFLKKHGYVPCIRLYINYRFTVKGVVIPPEKLPSASKIKAETFHQGKVSVEEIFKNAKRNNTRRK